MSSTDLVLAVIVLTAYGTLPGWSRTRWRWNDWIVWGVIGLDLLALLVLIPLQLTPWPIPCHYCTPDPTLFWR